MMFNSPAPSFRQVRAASTAELLKFFFSASFLLHHRGKKGFGGKKDASKYLGSIRPRPRIFWKFLSLWNMNGGDTRSRE
jgi:hypothetical protein